MSENKEREKDLETLQNQNQQLQQQLQLMSLMESVKNENEYRLRLLTTLSQINESVSQISLVLRKGLSSISQQIYDSNQLKQAELERGSKQDNSESLEEQVPETLDEDDDNDILDSDDEDDMMDLDIPKPTVKPSIPKPLDPRKAIKKISI